MERQEKLGLGLKALRLVNAQPAATVCSYFVCYDADNLLPPL